MDIDACVSEYTLDCLENDFNKFILDIVDDIGRNYLDKHDYSELMMIYNPDDILTDVLNILKKNVIYEIARNYCDIPYEKLVKELL